MRLLVVSDTHLGFRGGEFFERYLRALEPALAGSVDAVLHGGDIFHHPRVSPLVVDRAFAPLRRIADRGVPVVMVCGNHERSQIPAPLLALHPGIHIFREPETFVLNVAGQRIAFAGWPYLRRVRERFREALAQTRWQQHHADIRLLCLHQCIEGAVVGPAEHVFRRAPDVIRARELPTDVAAVISGHIHRHQILDCDLGGHPLERPVVFPGSTHRTSNAELGETKGFMTLDLMPSDRGGELVRWRHHALLPEPVR